MIAKIKILLTKLKPIFIAVFTGSVLACLGLLGYLTYSGQLKTDKITDSSKNLLTQVKIPRAYMVTSGSMEPAIKTGSIVITYPSPIYAVGDVITFAKSTGSKNFITHRIEARNFPDGLDKDPVYKTSGDANEEFDAGHVKPTQVAGKVVLTLPHLGYVANFARQPYGFILLVIVPATIVIYEEFKTLFYEIYKSIKKFREKRQQKRGVVQTIENKKITLPKIAIAIPVFGALFVIVAFSTGFFSDIEKNLGNILGAAQSFGEKTANLYNSDPFTCPGGATDTSGSTFGLTVLKIQGGDLKVSVKLSGATPNSSYDVWVNQDPGSCPLSQPSFPAALTTDGSGNAVVNNLNLPLVGGAANFWISAVGGGQVLRSTAVTLP